MYLFQATYFEVYYKCYYFYLGKSLDYHSLENHTETKQTNTKHLKPHRLSQESILKSFLICKDNCNQDCVCVEFDSICHAKPIPIESKKLLDALERSELYAPTEIKLDDGCEDIDSNSCPTKSLNDIQNNQLPVDNDDCSTCSASTNDTPDNYVSDNENYTLHCVDFGTCNDIQSHRPAENSGRIDHSEKLYIKIGDFIEIEHSTISRMKPTKKYKYGTILEISYDSNTNVTEVTCNWCNYSIPELYPTLQKDDKIKTLIRNKKPCIRTSDSPFLFP